MYSAIYCTGCMIPFLTLLRDEVSFRLLYVYFEFSNVASLALMVLHFTFCAQVGYFIQIVSSILEMV
jgi:hypothetical protein